MKSNYSIVSAYCAKFFKALTNCPFIVFCTIFWCCNGGTTICNGRTCTCQQCGFFTSCIWGNNWYLFFGCLLAFCIYSCSFFSFFSFATLVFCKCASCYSFNLLAINSFICGPFIIVVRQWLTGLSVVVFVDSLLVFLREVFLLHFPLWLLYLIL